MIKKLVYSAFLLAATSICFSFAKKDKGFQAKLTYEIIYEELPEMLEAYASMLPKEMIQYVKGPKMRIEQSAMGSVTITVVDSKKKSGFILMDQFGDKTAYVMDKKDFEAEASASQPTLEYVYTEETKTIAGYSCKKVEIKNNKENTTDYAWVTNEITASNTRQYPGLKGYPLEYSVHAAMGMALTMKVKTIEKMEVNDSFFKIPAGYTKKTMADLQKMATGG